MIYAGIKYSSLDMENTLTERIPEESEMEQAKQLFHNYKIKTAN